MLPGICTSVGKLVIKVPQLYLLKAGMLVAEGDCICLSQGEHIAQMWFLKALGSRALSALNKRL